MAAVTSHEVVSTTFGDREIVLERLNTFNPRTEFRLSILNPQNNNEPENFAWLSVENFRSLCEAIEKITGVTKEEDGSLKVDDAVRLGELTGRVTKVAEPFFPNDYHVDVKFDGEYLVTKNVPVKLLTKVIPQVPEAKAFSLNGRVAAVTHGTTKYAVTLKISEFETPITFTIAQARVLADGLKAHADAAEGKLK